MKRAVTFLILSSMAAEFVPLYAQKFRVEWLSGKIIQAVKFEAGTDALKLCSRGKNAGCLTLQPKITATCTPAASALRCQSDKVVRTFTRLTASSLSPFRIEAALRESPKGEDLRAGMAREAEIVETPKGPRVILMLDLESYVGGVLAGEAGVMKSQPALEAMAMVARTWALRSRGRHKREGFDFCSLTHCQVFSPASNSNEESPSAVGLALRNTQGKVVKFKGQLIDAYFSSNCGGMTEAAGDVWPDRAAPYLVSFRDTYCAGSEHSSWQQAITLASLTDILHKNLRAPFSGSLRFLGVERRAASGRAQVLRLDGDSSLHVDANEFRYAINRRLGWNTLKSNLYTVEKRGDGLVFTGRGLGHGVGLCQAGAERMGQLNIASEKIITTYFPGTEVAAMSSVRSADPVLSSEHFELVFPESQQPWVSVALQTLESARPEIEKHAGQLPAKIRVETFDTTPDFIRASNQPGWCAASTDGRSIQLQPLATLKRKGILGSTLRHELAHLAVHRQRSPNVPHWFEEGLVLFVTAEHIVAQPNFNFHGRTLEDCVSTPGSEAEMKAAYAVALDRVRSKARKTSEATLWQILRKPSEDDLRWLRGK